VFSQAIETGSSQATELEGARRSFTYLQQLGLSITTFVSDCHKGISKWIRENCVNTTHYYQGCCLTGALVASMGYQIFVQGRLPLSQGS